MAIKCTFIKQISVYKLKSQSLYFYFLKPSVFRNLIKITRVQLENTKIIALSKGLQIPLFKLGLDCTSLDMFLYFFRKEKGNKLNLS
ncbi:hypothetical protein PK35_13925 [Tamlana nanhaiensis]|uniref:Uncharacterized protein n=1 Tax=Neotamlana nanhaiensis TaxID=1382798 RepID=A0A0D7VXJ1_9FLAO|nr:hypothetical protein PK35_13925 [Tamlana nanhaiensis]